MRRFGFLFSLTVCTSLAILAEPIFQQLKWRSIGPHRGGRVTAVAGVPGQRGTYYFGSTGGGVWKTADGAKTWAPITDAALKTGSVGAIAVAPSDANVIFVGMGESAVRGNVSHGDGMYKSVDGGKTWTHTGLADTRHISRVRVHPRNPDVVYAAAMGHLFGPNEERGVFRSRDGGKSWQRVLFKSSRAGAVDLAMDPANPNVLYAAIWQVLRTPHSFESGGPDGAIFKSTDGGGNWTEITHNEGLPKGIIGKAAIAVSPVSSDRVYAIVEAEDGGVFRSNDAGKTWTRVNQKRDLRQRAWYYTRIYADPRVLDRVYVTNVQFWRSDDAGATFKSIPVPHGDNHDLWIDPDDGNRMVEGNDGGATVTTDGGKSWTGMEQATAQFYRVTVDNEFPYNIYGAQQDNTTVRIASRTTSYGITDRHWWPVGGGESGWIAPHPKNADIVFAGSYGGYLTRYDHKTGQYRIINVWPDNPMGYGVEGMKYRFQWNFPILFSPHDSNLLYTAGNMLFKTTNEGQSWEPISPDLTRNDKSKFGPSGGPITKDNTGVEYYGTIFTVAESALVKGVIWAGSDDGLVHLTRDGGKSWSNVTPPREMMPEWIQINSIDASPHDAGTAWVAATMYKADDFQPYLYVTRDYGKSWKKIVAGIPSNAFTRVVREDPARKGLLYAGTEAGINVSFNGGEVWESLQANLPVVPITDLVVHKGERDLVAATQGRSFWILDDLAVLHDMYDRRSTIESAAVHFFPTEPAYRMPGGRVPPQPGSSIGENPAPGPVFNYWLKDEPKGEVTLEILDSAGKPIRKYSSLKPKGLETPAAVGEDDEEEEGPRRPAAEPLAPAKKGLNAFNWNMRYPDAARFPGLVLWAGSTRGPLAAPGEHTARLTVEGKTYEQKFLIRKDPRVPTPQQEFDKQLALQLQIRDKLTETHNAISRIRDVRRQLDETTARSLDLPGGKEIEEAAKALNRQMTGVEEELYQTKLQSSQDPLNYPIKLNNKLAALGSVVSAGDYGPTAQSYQLHEELTSKINAQLKTLQSLLDKDLAAFNKLVRDRNVPAVAPKPVKQ